MGEDEGAHHPGGGAGDGEEGGRGRGRGVQAVGFHLASRFGWTVLTGARSRVRGELVKGRRAGGEISKPRPHDLRVSWSCCCDLHSRCSTSTLSPQVPGETPGEAAPAGKKTIETVKAVSSSSELSSHFFLPSYVLFFSCYFSLCGLSRATLSPASQAAASAPWMFVISSLVLCRRSGSWRLWSFTGRKAGSWRSTSTCVRLQRKRWGAASVRCFSSMPGSNGRMQSGRVGLQMFMFFHLLVCALAASSTQTQSHPGGLWKCFSKWTDGEEHVCSQ